MVLRAGMRLFGPAGAAGGRWKHAKEATLGNRERHYNCSLWKAGIWYIHCEISQLLVQPVHEESLVSFQSLCLTVAKMRPCEQVIFLTIQGYTASDFFTIIQNPSYLAGSSTPIQCSHCILRSYT